MLEGGEVYLGGYLAVLGLRTHRGLPPADTCCVLRPEGREPALPRYHPPWRCHCTAPSLGSRCRFYSPWVARGPWAEPTVQARGRSPLSKTFFRRLRGDLHVVHAPGLPPSPGRCWLRTALLVPSMPLARPSVRGRTDSGRPDFRQPGEAGRRRLGRGGGRAVREGARAARRDGSGAARRAGRRAQAVTRMASGRAPRRGDGLPAGERGTNEADRTPGPGGRSRRAVRPVAAWRAAIYRSRHDSRTKSHM